MSDTFWFIYLGKDGCTAVLVRFYHPSGLARGVLNECLFNLELHLSIGRSFFQFMLTAVMVWLHPSAASRGLK